MADESALDAEASDDPSMQRIPPMATESRPEVDESAPSPMDEDDDLYDTAGQESHGSAPVPALPSEQHFDGELGSLPCAPSPRPASCGAMTWPHADADTPHMPGLGLLKESPKTSTFANKGTESSANSESDSQREHSQSLHTRTGVPNSDRPLEKDLKSSPSEHHDAPIAGEDCHPTVSHLEIGALNDGISTVGTDQGAVSAPGSLHQPPDTLEQRTEQSQLAVPHKSGGTQRPPAGPPTEEELHKQEAKAEFLRVGEANKGDQDAEWQLDSSNSASSSDSSDSDLSDDSSDSSSERQVREPMLEDDEDEPGDGTALRTEHERDEEFEKPDLVVTPDMKITELGTVETKVDNVVLIKAKTSGDYRVLEAGSILCAEDRAVVGAVAETLGRVEEPRYLVGFPRAPDADALNLGTVVFYVDAHSTFVFTEPLKAYKGTDASNIHDEETNEVEFSDDENEAAHKRELKEAKQASKAAATGNANEFRKEKSNQRGRRNKAQGRKNQSHDAPAAPESGQYQNGGLDYDDGGELDMYRPLARPDQSRGAAGAVPPESRGRGRRGGHADSGRGAPQRSRGWVGRGNSRRFPRRGGFPQERHHPDSAQGSLTYPCLRL